MTGEQAVVEITEEERTEKKEKREGEVWSAVKRKPDSLLKRKNIEEKM